MLNFTERVGKSASRLDKVEVSLYYNSDNYASEKHAE